jgi:hypothetical protein
LAFAEEIIMKVRLGTVLAVVCGGVSLALLLGSLPAVAGTPQLIAAGAGGVALAAPAAGEESGYSYIGCKSCKKCHFKEYKSWSKTKMAKAFETLKPGEAAEAKEKHGLDPQKDYTTDESCLKCHATGFGSEGGYAVPDPSDKKAVKQAEALAGVGCESCHGPGSHYSEVLEEILKSKRTYKVEELYAVGLQKMDASRCTNCHNDTSPTYDKEKAFDYERDKDKDIHEHEELKQREG